jgi:Ca2+-binding EF-hand superfamily protein
MTKHEMEAGLRRCGIKIVDADMREIVNVFDSSDNDKINVKGA